MSGALYDPKDVPASLRDCFEEIEVTCGAPWVRQTTVEREPDPTAGANAMRGAGHFRNTISGPANREGREFERVISTKTTGWAASCKCPDNIPVPATVLDPFGGSGTTGLVADSLGRDCILIELHPKYAEMAQARLRAGLAAVDAPDPAPETAGPLFEVSHANG